MKHLVSVQCGFCGDKDLVPPRDLELIKDQVKDVCYACAFPKFGKQFVRAQLRHRREVEGKQEIEDFKFYQDGLKMYRAKPYLWGVGVPLITWINYPRRPGIYDIEMGLETHRGVREGEANVILRKLQIPS